MTQSGISYQVRLLEDHVQGPLFSKQGRGVVLTPLGERLAPALSLAFDGMAKAFADARPEGESVLTISCTQVFGANWLAPRIGRFQVQHPWLAVRVVTHDQIVDIAAGEADVAIRNSVAPWPGLASDFLMRVPIVPMGHPSWLAKYPDGLTPDDVIRLPRTSVDDPWWGMWHEAVTGSAPETMSSPSLRLDSQLLEGNAAMAGHGVAMLNPLMWQSQIEQGVLTPLSARMSTARASLWLSYLPRRRDERKIRYFRQWLMAENAATLEWFSVRFDSEFGGRLSE